MYIIIPMAGESSRFFNAGYTVPKYMLPLGSETVFDKAIKSLANTILDEHIHTCLLESIKQEKYEVLDEITQLFRRFQ